EDIKKILCYKDVISRITAAPEIYGTLTMAEKLRNCDILFSVGHSNANNEDMLRALESGYSHITHFYSATSTVRRVNAYRVPGVIESGYLLDGYTVEVIADGHHLPPDLLKLIYKIKGSARIALVTDAIRVAGLPEGQKAKGSGGREIIIEGGVAKLPDRSAFAGSVSTMELLVKNMVELAEVPLNEAVTMATATPAKILGLGNKGIINPGMDADLVVMDKEFCVRLVMSDGKVFYDRTEMI
ncbi:MAG: amidohydrolase family protein, partial [Ruminiclostridium sp.]|nr:amidohydrolase family protein [Ruminiclostridium sp.]